MNHWKMDETYIKIKGKWYYLYRSIDVQGMTLDLWLRRKRDTKSAFSSLQKLGKYKKTEHRRIKFLKNLIEQPS